MEKTDKKTDILNAAEVLFSQLGYEGTSTRHIAKESGANLAMINYYFGSKEGVFLEIMESRIFNFKTQLDLINQENIPVKEKLLKVIEQYTTRIFSNISFHKMMHRELSLTQRPEVFTKIKDAMAQNLAVIDSIINSGIDEGSFRKVDVRLCIASIMGSISMIVSSPNKVVSDQGFNINIDSQRENLKERTINHLQDLMLSYLTIYKK